MRRPRLGALAASTALVLTFAACGSDGDSGDNDPTADSSSDHTAESTEETSAAEPGSLSAEDVQAKLAAGAPPEDLTWVVPDVPSGWRELQVGQGEQQWQVGESRCIVLLRQPAGLGTDDEPTSQDVATDLVTTSVKSAGATADAEPPTERLFTNHVNAEGVQAKTEFSGVHFTGAPGDIEGQAYGYRAGDFALGAIAMCGNGEYAEHGSDLEEFLESLAARTTY